MDPSLSKSYTEKYSAFLPVELRNFEAPNQLGNVENLTLRIFIKGPDNNPKEVKIELQSEEDLFFHYVHYRNVDTFRDMQQKHKLLIKLKDYPKLLQELLTNVISSPTMFIAVFYMDQEGLGRLDIVQNMSYKFMEVISCEFKISPDDVVRKSIIYRYNQQVSKMKDTEEQINEMEKLIRHRAAGLLPAVKKITKSLAK